MKIIDSHVHFSNVSSFKHCAANESFVDYSYDGYIKECEKNNVVKSVCMGVFETWDVFPSKDAATPMLADLDERMPPGMYLCPGINPHTLNDESIAALDRLVKESKNVVGAKIFAGYYHFDPYSDVYEPVLRIAEKHGITIAVHTGDTYSNKGLLEYSHPLKIDRLAVTHPDLKIVICHMGVPWVFDACEVAYKNSNVYIDLSGILCGDKEFEDIDGQIARYVQAIKYLNNYKKLMYGTDWPLTSMEAYINFCRKLVPEEQYEDVFYKNAVEVYGLDK